MPPPVPDPNITAPGRVSASNPNDLLAEQGGLNLTDPETGTGTGNSTIPKKKKKRRPPPPPPPPEEESGGDDIIFFAFLFMCCCVIVLL